MKLQKVFSFSSFNELFGQRGRQLFSRAYNTFSRKPLLGVRDLYKENGWIDRPTYADHEGAYVRIPLAKRVIDTYPDATLRKVPKIYDRDDRAETPFSKAVDDLFLEHDLPSKFREVYRLALLGQYATLVLGTNDRNLERSLDVAGNNELMYVKPYSELSSEIRKYDLDENSEHFGLPLEYLLYVRLNYSSVRGARVQPEERTLKVHGSRVVHVAVNTLDNINYGIPMLQAIWNRPYDIEKVTGAASELFRKNGVGKLGVQYDKEVEMPDEEESKKAKKAAEESLENVLQTRGATVSTLQFSVPDPQPTHKIVIQEIAAATGIPARILIGTEEAQAAGAQDDAHFTEQVEVRRRNHVEAKIIRPFLDRCIEYGIIPHPENDKYQFEWESVVEEDKAKAITAAKTFVDGLNVLAANRDSMTLRQYYELAGVKYKPEEIEQEQAPENTDIQETRNLPNPPPRASRDTQEN